MIELSLALHVPLSVVRQMPEADVQLYAAYDLQFMLPFKRQEHYAAYGNYLTAATMGGDKRHPSEFVIGAEKTAQTVTDLREIDELLSKEDW